MSENYCVPGAEPSRFAFPFAAVPQGARVLIYGGGIVGKTFVQEVGRTGHCQIVAMADKRPQLVKVEGIRVICPEDIPKESFDFLLIAMERQDLAAEVWRTFRNIVVSDSKMRWIDPSRRR